MEAAPKTIDALELQSIDLVSVIANILDSGKPVDARHWIALATASDRVAAVLAARGYEVNGGLASGYLDQAVQGSIW